MVEVHVDRLGGDGGELVAEAHLVDAAHGGPVREHVVLPLRLVVEDIVQGVCDEAVHIVVPPSYDLQRVQTMRARAQREA